MVVRLPLKSAQLPSLDVPRPVSVGRRGHTNVPARGEKVPKRLSFGWIVAGNGVTGDPDGAVLHAVALAFRSPAPVGVEDHHLAHRAGFLQFVHRRTGTHHVSGGA